MQHLYKSVFTNLTSILTMCRGEKIAMTNELRSVLACVKSGAVRSLWKREPENLRSARRNLYGARKGFNLSRFQKIIPKISKLGYNSIQLMAVMEHAYYSAFKICVQFEKHQLWKIGFPAENFTSKTSRKTKFLVPDQNCWTQCTLVLVTRSLRFSRRVADSAYFHKGLRGNHSQCDF